MTIRAKILGGFIVMAVIAAILGGTGLVATKMLTDKVNEIHDMEIIASSTSGVLNAHYNWRHGLTEAVLSGKEFTGSLNPDTCALGQWIDSEEARSITDPEVLSLLAEIDEPHAFIHTEAQQVVDLLQAGRQERARNLLVEEILPKTQDVITKLTQIEQRIDDLMEDTSEQTIRLGTLLSTISIVFVAVAVVACVLLALRIAAGISVPLRHLTAFLKKAGETGDLALTQTDVEIVSKFAVQKDEIGQCINSAAKFVSRLQDVSDALETVSGGDLRVDLAALSDKDTMGNALAHVTENLNEMFSEIRSATAQVSTGSKQIADGAQALAQGATQQAATVQELSASISEIARKSKDSADMAGRTATMADAIKESAEKGNHQMDQMMDAVKEISQASQSISKVIKVIDDIAFQTNILALNAAVEAARAGQHGKGFAVVAEEVRNLAAKSSEAAKDTGGLIANSMEKATLGSRIAGETAASLAEIVSGINESTRFISEIAATSQEQSASVSEVTQGIDQVTQVIQQNSATAEESAAASEEMSGQANMLNELATQFKLKQ